jgi:hypothetical protein
LVYGLLELLKPPRLKQDKDDQEENGERDSELNGRSPGSAGAQTTLHCFDDFQSKS